MFVKTIIVGILVFFFGLAVGYQIKTISTNKSSYANPKCPDTYKYINELVDCNSKQVIDKGLYTKFSFILKEYLLDRQSSEDISHASIYFRDLVQGPTFGINEDTDFSPASLLKLPMLITYLGIAENDPSILDKKTRFIEVKNTTIPNIKPEQEIEINKFYSVDDLLSRMIIYSDNLAYGLLDKFLLRLYPDKNVYTETMQELGLINPQDPTESTFSVRTYSSLFRQLYNGSYLSFENSEKALSLLSKTKFKEGLPAGVPQGIQIAHKFGEREILEINEKQFHDCGIIYYPQNPYLLCIMTRGKDMNVLINTIGEISEMVYKEVDSRRIR